MGWDPLQSFGRTSCQSSLTRVEVCQLDSCRRTCYHNLLTAVGHCQVGNKRLTTISGGFCPPVPFCSSCMTQEFQAYVLNQLKNHSNIRLAEWKGVEVSDQKKGEQYADLRSVFANAVHRNFVSLDGYPLFAVVLSSFNKATVHETNNAVLRLMKYADGANGRCSCRKIDTLDQRNSTKRWTSYLAENSPIDFVSSSMFKSIWSLMFYQWQARSGVKVAFDAARWMDLRALPSWCWWIVAYSIFEQDGKMVK